MRKLERSDYEFLDRLLISLHVIFDGWFFLFIIPTNILGGAKFKLFNAALALIIAGANLIYQLHCPLTVWHNRVKKKLDPNVKTNTTTIGWLINKSGLGSPSLRAVNVGVTVFLVVMIATFF